MHEKEKRIHAAIMDYYARRGANV